MGDFWSWFDENWHNPVIDLSNAGRGFLLWLSGGTYDSWNPQRDPTLDFVLDLMTSGPPPPSASASPDQIKQFEYMFANLPVYGDWLRARDNFNYISDYLRNNDMNWSDILYPSRVTGSGSSPYGSLNFVSSNLKKLYR